MYKITKLINNNALLSEKENQEYILYGNGIGFNKKKGELIPEKDIFKIFKLTKDDRDDIMELVNTNIDIEIIEFAIGILKNLKETLNNNINEYECLGLAEHIYFLLKRIRENHSFTSPLDWNIQKIYSNEYKLSLQIIKDIENKFFVNIPNSEASFLTLHIVNAYLDTKNMEETMQVTTIVNEIVKIVEEYNESRYENSSSNFERFLVHLRFFVQAQLNGEYSNNDSSLLQAVSQTYEIDYHCALCIKDFLEDTYNMNVTPDQILYLTLHLNRLSNK